MNTQVLAAALMIAAHPTRSPNREADERFFHFKFDDAVAYDNGRTVGRVTAFTRVDKDGKTYASFAECDVRDQFCKRTGRVVARRKWFRNPEKRVEVPTKANYEQLLAAWKNS